MEYETNEPKHIKVRGAKVHNLKNIDVDVPLHKIVGIAGVIDQYVAEAQTLAGIE